MIRQNAGDRGQHPRKSSGKTAVIACLLSIVSCLLIFTPAFAQEDMVKVIEAKRIELKEKEDALKHEEQRLNVLRKEVDERIETYATLLTQVEAAVKKGEEIKNERIESVVKAYEIMPPEDAAVRLTVLDDDIALQIMTRMKSKKAGAIIAIMEPRKAAALTKSMTTLSSKKGK